MAVSSASRSLEHKRLSGFLRNSFLIIDTASFDKECGYLTSSFTIESNTSSSFGNGDYI